MPETKSNETKRNRCVSFRFARRQSRDWRKLETLVIAYVVCVTLSLIVIPIRQYPTCGGWFMVIVQKNYVLSLTGQWRRHHPSPSRCAAFLPRRSISPRVRISPRRLPARVDVYFLTTNSAHIGRIRASEHCAQTDELALCTLSSAYSDQRRRQTQTGTDRQKDIRETE